MKQAPLKSILILCRIHAIADTFRSAINAADPRIEVVVYPTSAEYLADLKAPRAIELTVILASGDLIRIAAMVAALQVHGVPRALAVYLGDGPPPQGSSFATLSPNAGFEQILNAIQNMIGLCKATTAIDRLTLKQRNILHYVALRLTDQEIARRVGIQRTTVSDHVGRILKALGARNRTVAALLYRQLKVD